MVKHGVFVNFDERGQPPPLLIPVSAESYFAATREPLRGVEDAGDGQPGAPSLIAHQPLVAPGSTPGRGGGSNVQSPAR